MAKKQEPRRSAPPKSSRHPFQHVADVTPQHADTFVRAFFKMSADSGVLAEAIESTGIMGWPDAPAGTLAPSTPEQQAYHDVQDAIADQVRRRIAPILSSEFQAAAQRALGVESKVKCPSWSIIPEERNPTQKEWHRYKQRTQENAVTFVREPKTTYTAEEVGEILGEPPDRVPEIMARFESKLYQHPAGGFARAHVAIAAADRMTWTPAELLYAVVEGGWEWSSEGGGISEEVEDAADRMASEVGQEVRRSRRSTKRSA